MPSQVLTDSIGYPVERVRLLVLALFGDPPRDREKGAFAFAFAPTSGRQGRRLRGGCVHDVDTVSRAQRIDEIPSLDVHRRDRIDHPESARGGGQRVESDALLEAELLRLPHP